MDACSIPRNVGGGGIGGAIFMVVIGLVANQMMKKAK